MREMIEFDDDCKLTFPLVFRGRSLQCYVPQPDFGRTKLAIPVLRELSNRLNQFSFATYSKDFPLFFEEALKVAKEQKYNDVKSHFDAWFGEIEQMSSIIEVETKKTMSYADFKNALTTKAQQKAFKETFKAWVCFFFSLCRYFGEQMETRESEQYYTQLSLEEYESAFLKSLEATALSSQDLKEEVE